MYARDVACGAQDCRLFYTSALSADRGTTRPAPRIALGHHTHMLPSALAEQLLTPHPMTLCIAATPQPWMSCFQRNVQKVARLKIIDSPGAYFSNPPDTLDLFTKVVQ